MEPQNQPKVSPKILLIAGGLLVMLILVFSLMTLGRNATKKTTTEKQDQAKTQEEQIRRSLSLTPTPTYVPPSNASFTTAESVNFLPNTINNFTVDKTSVLKTAKQVYSNLEGISLMNQINKDIFTWLALNEFYQTKDITKVSSSYSTNRIDNIATISKDIAVVKNNYNLDVMKIDGFYLKLLYKGTTPGNLKKLKKTEAELRPLALQLITNYRNEAVKNPQTVLSNFNKNNTVLLMNNRQASINFTSYPLYPALVGDLNYDTFIRSLPVGQVSNILTLRTKLKGSSVPQDYANAVFYISKKTGTNLPVDALADAYVAKSTIK